MSSVPVPPTSTPTLSGAFGVIEKAVLGSAAASISITGISTDNKIFRVSGYILNDANSKQARFRLNNDSSGNYDKEYVTATSSTLTARRETGRNSCILFDLQSLTASEQAGFEFIVGKQVTGDEAMVLGRMAYDGATATAILLGESAYTWKNTADLISRMDVIADSDTFDTGTTMLFEGNLTT